MNLISVGKTPFLVKDAATTTVSTLTPLGTTATPFPMVTTQGSTILPLKPSYSFNIFIKFTEIRAHFVGHHNC